MRLTDREAADITAFLMSSRDTAFENLQMPEPDSEIRDEMVLKYLRNNQTIEQSVASQEAPQTLRHSVTRNVNQVATELEPLLGLVGEEAT